MRAAWAIYKKELRVYFVSPLAYVFLVAFLFLAGMFFYLDVSSNGEASLRGMHGNLSVLLLFLLPLLTMRHFAEERRSGTFELMMTAPVPLWSLLLGKWASTVTLCVIRNAGLVIQYMKRIDQFGFQWVRALDTILGSHYCLQAFTLWVIRHAGVTAVRVGPHGMCHAPVWHRVGRVGRRCLLV